jgi:hypothetical protein
VWDMELIFLLDGIAGDGEQTAVSCTASTVITAALPLRARRWVTGGENGRMSAVKIAAPNACGDCVIEKREKSARRYCNRQTSMLVVLYSTDQSQFEFLSVELVFRVFNDQEPAIRPLKLFTTLPGLYGPHGWTYTVGLVQPI